MVVVLVLLQREGDHM